MNVLVLNCGNSSVNFRLNATDLDLIAQNADRRLATGTIERIGGEAFIRRSVSLSVTTYYSQLSVFLSQVVSRVVARFSATLFQLARELHA